MYGNPCPGAQIRFLGVLGAGRLVLCGLESYPLRVERDVGFGEYHSLSSRAGVGGKFVRDKGAENYASWDVGCLQFVQFISMEQTNNSLAQLGRMVQR